MKYQALHLERNDLLRRLRLFVVHYFMAPIHCVGRSGYESLRVHIERGKSRFISFVPHGNNANELWANERGCDSRHDSLVPREHKSFYEKGAFVSRPSHPFI